MLTLLMYHRILPGEHPDAISSAQFERELDYLERHYRILTPEEVIAWVRGELCERRACAALSFDDGWLDNWLFATPILRKRGLRAVSAVSAGYLHEGKLRDGETDAVLYLRNREAQARAAAGDFCSYANLAELKAMEDSGVWRLEAHGTRHVKGTAGASVLALPQSGETPEMFRRRLRDDIGGCCEKLAAITARRPQMFFWPWGHYTTAAAEAVRAFGLIQFTVAKGSISSGDRRLVLPRVGVSPRWRKFRRKCFVFRSRPLTKLHGLFHTEKVCFDDFFPSREEP